MLSVALAPDLSIEVIMVMVVTIAPDQQACILQLHPTSSQDGSEHLQHTDILLSGCFCVDTLHYIRIFSHLW